MGKGQGGDDRGKECKKIEGFEGWGGDVQVRTGEKGHEEFRLMPGWWHLGFSLEQEGKGKTAESPPPPEVS